LNATVTVSQPRSFLEELYALPGGEDLRLCIQCGTCAGSCPNANKMDYTPREAIAMIRAGMMEEVLRSNSMWFCVSCYLCTVRCPRGIHLTDIMYELKQLAIRHRLTRKGGRTSTLARTFVENVNKNGRVHEFGMLMRYFWRIDLWGLVRLLPLGWKLFRRGRLPLRAHGISPRGKEQLRAIIQRAQELEAAL
jgi:heterodisulfide reductase subunit C